MKVLITGGSGFAGSHLVDFLLNHSRDRLIALYHCHKPDRRAARLQWVKLDLRDSDAVIRVLKRYRPDQIYHLASVVGVGRLQKNPAPALEANVAGSANLFEAVRQIVPKARILNVGSAEEYGKVNSAQMPILESTPLRPFTAYGISKMCQEQIAFCYANFFNLQVIFTRTFHYTGPRQPLGFVFPDLINQVVRCQGQKRGQRILVGNLSARRDFTDIRDVVRAYWLLMRKAKAGDVFNVASGHARSIQHYLDLMVRMSGVNCQVKMDPAKVRRVDVPLFSGNTQKIHQVIGWSPRIDLVATIQEMIRERQSV